MYNIAMVSVVIPSRNEKFLNNTINDILQKAGGDIEIVVVLEGYWPDELVTEKRIKYIHRGAARGMRDAINAGVELASGEYIMKCDAHILFDEEFDLKLLKDMQDDWVVIPRRKRLDAENWCVQDVGKPDIDYCYLSFPDDPNDFGGPGLNGKVWQAKATKKTDPKYDIDDEISFQGSCWFMKRDYFYFLELMDDKNWGPFWNEAQEIGFKAWLSGGKVMRNKKTWYAHLHKGKKYGRMYSLDNSWAEIGATYTKKWLFNDKMWSKQKYPLTWLIERFLPMPTWPDDWREKLGINSNTTENTTDEINDASYADENVPTMKNRIELAEYFKKLGFKRGVEVGVCDGRYSEILMQKIPDLTLFGIDPYTAYSDSSKGRSQDTLDEKRKQATDRLAKYDKYELVIAFSIEAAKLFGDETLDFVFIDANHKYEYVKQDIEAWAAKVKPGGIVSGHDYYEFKSGDVVKAVNDYVKKHGIKLYTTEYDPDAHRDDRQPDWFFFK